MRVFVTGASGFVGSAVVRALRQRDYEVTGLVHTPQKGQALERLGATAVVGDMMQPTSYESAVKQVDVVVHSAQYSIQGRFTGAKLKQIEQADATMTTTLARACLAHDKALIYTSGCFNYGDCGETWITEQTPFHPSPLGEGHTRMVQTLLPLHAEQGLRVIILSPGFVYGPGGLLKQAFYDTLQKGQLRSFGAGRNYWSVIHVDDLAAVYARAVESDAYGETYNVVDDQPLRLRELIDQFTDALGKRRVGSLPPWLLKPLIGAPLVDSLITSFRIKNDKVKTAFDWRPQYATFHDGIPTVAAELARQPSNTSPT